MARLASMRLQDISDREVLLILHDVCDHDGWAVARDLAQKLNINHERANSLVGGRLGWLFRFGAVEREYRYDHQGNMLYTREGKIRYTQRWRMTAVGEAMAFGKLTKQEEDRLHKLRDDQLLLVTRFVASRALRSGDTARALTGREWRHSMDPVRLTNGNGKVRK